MAFATDLNCLLTIDAHRRSVSTRTSLIEFSCPSCAYRTPTTFEWASEYGVIQFGSVAFAPLDLADGVVDVFEAVLENFGEGARCHGPPSLNDAGGFYAAPQPTERKSGDPDEPTRRIN